jgi:hypothetical protein
MIAEISPHVLVRAWLAAVEQRLLVVLDGSKGGRSRRGGLTRRLTARHAALLDGRNAYRSVGCRGAVPIRTEG